VHGACLAHLARPCVGAFLQGELADTGPHYSGQLVLDICPELSLVEQDYECAECGAELVPGQVAADHPLLGRASPPLRLCDYTDRSHCTSCPPPPGSSPTGTSLCASLKYLALTARRPLVHLAHAAPGLAAVTEEVAAVAGQRHHLLTMKKYFVVCR
jgi:hypothetical protein